MAGRFDLLIEDETHFATHTWNAINPAFSAANAAWRELPSRGFGRP
jgi:hypothetical protein